jgi:hypothetical protein
MKNLLALALLLIASMAKPASAQLLPAGEYHVANEQTVVVNNQAYLTYDFQKKSNPNLDRLLLGTNILVTGAAAYGTFKWTPSQNLMPQDKLKHVMAGYVIGNVTNAGFQLILPAEMKHKKLYSFLAGVGASVLVGVGKEIRDSYGYGHVELMDAVATSAGGAMGSFTMNFTDVSNAFKRKHRSHL